MRPRIQTRRVVLAVATVLGMTSSASLVNAQQDKLDQLARNARRDFGIDDTTFRRLFGPAFRQRRPAPLVSTTPEQLADQVREHMTARQHATVAAFRRDVRRVT